MNIYILFFFCIFSSLSVSKAFADTISDEQTWLSFSSLGSLNKQSKLLYWFDLRVRYGDTFSDVQTTLLRPGVGVKASDTLTLLAGYARFSAHRSGPNKNEHRFWQDTSKLLGSFAGGFVKGRLCFSVAMIKDCTGL